MAFADPAHNIEQFMLGEGMHVADVGAGGGAYVMAAARSVGEKGRVFAVEIQKELLDRIKNSARSEGLYNVEIIWGDLEKLGGTKLRDFSMDAVIVSNVLFQIHDKKTFTQEVKRILKPRGKVLVVDWYESFGNLGPRDQSIVSKDAAKELFGDRGFEIEKDVEAGEHHYGFIARNTLGA